MFTGHKTTEDLTRCLTDAGCSEEMIACLLSCLSDGNKQECLSRLEEWREKLLGDIRKERSGMEYLDGLLAGIREKNRWSTEK